MPGTGIAELDFGVFPGSNSASVVVAGQSEIVSGSLVEAWIRPQGTADHSADDHIIDPPRIIAADISAGVGFTIHGFSNNSIRHWGKYTVAWVWN